MRFRLEGQKACVGRTWVETENLLNRLTSHQDFPRETPALLRLRSAQVTAGRDSGRRGSPPCGDWVSVGSLGNITTVSYSRPTAGLAGCEVCGEDVRPGGVSGCGSNRVRLPTLGNPIGENQAFTPLGNPQ